MSPEELSDLLEMPECASVEFKEDFPQELRGGRSASGWDKGRAELLKDIAAMANAFEPGPGHIVYGVADKPRAVPGLTMHFDDADLQQWAAHHFAPAISFAYSDVERERGLFVGIVEVRRIVEYPHVVTRDLGGVLHRGQVWYRRGTSNDVADHDALRAMFMGEQPFVVGGSQDRHWLQAIRHYEELGFEVVTPCPCDRDGLVADGYLPACFPGTRRPMCAQPYLAPIDAYMLCRPVTRD